MANIMLTDVCNLKCPYCFANEFVNKNINEITEENFDKAVEFIVGDRSQSSVGLIGGEPTLHPKFDLFLKKLIKNDNVKTIVLYTNGISLDKYWDIICHPKINILVNCNSPQDMGEIFYSKLCRNLDYIINTRMFKENVTLGINMYCPDFQYTYILDLLKTYVYHRVRVSITVPNLKDERNRDAHAYFLSMKDRLLQFFHELLKNEIIPYFDCNKIPSCLISEKDINTFKKYLDNKFIKENIYKSNIMNSIVKCSPVIDIMQDLTAVRCFGLSEYTKQKISNFSGIKELADYYIRTIDAYAYNTVYSHKCIDCHSRQVLKCNGGCLAFKINDILNIHNYSKHLMREK